MRQSKKNRPVAGLRIFNADHKTYCRICRLTTATSNKISSYVSAVYTLCKEPTVRPVYIRITETLLSLRSRLFKDSYTNHRSDPPPSYFQEKQQVGLGGSGSLVDSTRFVRRVAGSKFESRSSRHLGTLGKSFTLSWLWCLGVKLTESMLCGEHLWVVA